MPRADLPGVSRREGAVLRGAGPGTVRRAVREADPLPGARGPDPGRRDWDDDPEAGVGFGGMIDGALVRDVLGRYPVFVDDAGDLFDGGDPSPGAWAFTRERLANPRRLPAGTVRDADGERPVWSLPDPPVSDVRTASRRLRAALTDALGFEQERDGRDTAVAFSGGLDSALVAAGRPDATLYVAGFAGCHDVHAARTAAGEMGREGDLRVVELSHADIERLVPRVVAATGRTNAMDVAIGVPLLAVAERAADEGREALALGQGADELFGGYAKVADPASDPRVDAGTVRTAVRETVAALPGQLARDVPLLDAAGVAGLTPYLTDDVVDAALRLPGALLVDGHERKVGLRRFAARSGAVPQTAWGAEKKALQYGSGVSRELDRLARRAGFKRRQGNHVGRYVADLAGADR